MKALIIKHKLILIGLVLSSTAYWTMVSHNFELFEKTTHFLNSFEKYELDEMLISFSFFSLFVVIDHINKKKVQDIELEKAKIYQAMLSSTHHILNNFLNQMQIFKFSAEETPEFPPDVLPLFDQIIEEASEKIEALSNITQVTEASIMASTILIEEEMSSERKTDEK